MRGSLDRFLRHSTGPSRRASLGQVFSVTCESWLLKDDPRVDPPEISIVATRRTAADAADIAREAARDFRRRGFHKPSRAWWGADATHFHRFVVHTPQQRPTLALLLISGLAAGAALALTRRKRPRDGGGAG